MYLIMLVLRHIDVTRLVWNYSRNKGNGWEMFDESLL